MANESVPLIELRQVSKQFGQAPGGMIQRLGLSRPRPQTRAVDSVDLRIVRGEVVGLVGSPAAANPPWGAWSPACCPPPAAV